MTASNRAALIGKLHTALKKHYQVQPSPPARPLLDHVLYASLLEDAPYDLADEALAKCEQEFFDWNEVRVTTITELSQVFANLPDPAKAAQRIKGNLQAIFEEFYTFDLDYLKKENLGKAVGKFEKMPGMTPFVLSYTIQHGLGGHSIPVDYSAMVVMLVVGVASQTEASSGRVPGLERAIPKSKGIEFGSLLHQAAVAINSDQNDKTGRAVLEAVSKGAAEQLDDWLKSKAAAKKRVARRRADEKAAKGRDQDEETPQAAADTKSVPAKSSRTTKSSKATKSTQAAKSTPATKPPPPGKPKSAKTKAKKTAAKSADVTPNDTKQVDTKQVDTKQVETKQVETKQVETKQVDTKQVETKQADAKQADDSPDKKAKAKAVKKSVKKTSDPTGETTKPKAARKSAKKKKTAPGDPSHAAADTAKSDASGKKSSNRKLTKRKPR